MFAVDSLSSALTHDDTMASVPNFDRNLAKVSSKLMVPEYVPSTTGQPPISLIKSVTGFVPRLLMVPEINKNCLQLEVNFTDVAVETSLN